VSAAFLARTLDANGIVVDIGRAFDLVMTDQTLWQSRGGAA